MLRRFLTSSFCIIISAVALGQITGEAGIVNPATSFYDLNTLTPSHLASPIIPYGGGGWNTSQSYDPCIPDPTADPMVMLFSGMAAPAGSGVQQLGRATATQAAFATNPVTAWTMDASNPTLTVGTAGQPDATYIRQSSCLYNPDDGNKLYEYYTCHNTVDQMCLAISTDNGHTWAKQGVVMSPAVDGCADETWVSQGAVLRLGTGNWVMVYSWRNSGITLPGVRAVTSSDGVHWNTGTCTNLVTTTPLYLEQHQIFMLNGQCVMLAEIGNNGFNWTIKSLVAPNCTSSFTYGSNSPILKGTGNASDWDWNLVATPYYTVIGNEGYIVYAATNQANTNYNVNQYGLGIAEFPVTYFTVQ